MQAHVVTCSHIRTHTDVNSCRVHLYRYAVLEKTLMYKHTTGFAQETRPLLAYLCAGVRPYSSYRTAVNVRPWLRKLACLCSHIPIYIYYLWKIFLFHFIYLFFFFFSFSNTPIPHAIVFLSRFSVFSSPKRWRRTRRDSANSACSCRNIPLIARMRNFWVDNGQKAGIASERIRFDPMLQLAHDNSVKCIIRFDLPHSFYSIYSLALVKSFFFSIYSVQCGKNASHTHFIMNPGVILKIESQY